MATLTAIMTTVRRCGFFFDRRGGRLVLIASSEQIWGVDVTKLRDASKGYLRTLCGCGAGAGIKLEIFAGADIILRVRCGCGLQYCTHAPL